MSGLVERLLETHTTTRRTKGGAIVETTVSYNRDGKPAAARIAALEAMIKLLVSAIEQAPPEVFGVGGGKHEGSTHWWIRDELVTAARAHLRGEGE